MLQQDDGGESKAALDQYVAPGLRLWMLISLVAVSFKTFDALQPSMNATKTRYK